MRCQSCGELQTVPVGTDPRVAPCSNCSEFLRHLDEGKRYLVVASNPAIGFAWLRDLTKIGRPALCMTSAAVERMRLEFGVKEIPIVQVAGHAAGAIDPKDLDPIGLRPILQITRERKGGVILYDGLDEIIAEPSLADVIRFLRKANDMAFVNGVSAIAPTGVSRGTRISFRFSFIATAAARVTRLSAMPAAIFARVVPLHGTTTTAPKRAEPDAGAAARLSSLYADRAPAANSSVVRPVSISMTVAASFVVMTSARSPRISMRRRAYSTPEAPHTASTTRDSEDTLVGGAECN